MPSTSGAQAEVTRPRAPVMRPAVAIAGVTSIAAALVHAAAAGNHEGDAILVWMFGLCAVAQLLWGVIAIAAMSLRASAASMAAFSAPRLRGPIVFGR